MWYVLIVFALGVSLTYIAAITLEKVFYRIGKKKKKKKDKTSTYVSRRQRMKEYNKRF